MNVTELAKSCSLMMAVLKFKTVEFEVHFSRTKDVWLICHESIPGHGNFLEVSGSSPEEAVVALHAKLQSILEIEELHCQKKAHEIASALRMSKEASL
jgi:hypothetical protein